MLSNLRRLVTNPIGAAIALGFVALLGLAFVMSDRSGQAGPTKTLDAADVVAKVGTKQISTAELKAAVLRDVQNYAQQQPGLTVAQYIALGGLESTLDRLITTTAIRQFGEKQGMVVSKRAVDGIIAGTPGLQGIDGKFSQALYDSALKRQGITDDEARTQLSAQVQLRNLMLPATSTGQVPVQLAMPYADLLLEKRSGQIGIIPVQAIGAGAAPTDAELTTWYSRNQSRYRVPERRLFRYALVSATALGAQAMPTDAEVAAAYKADAGKYAAADLRSVAQVIVADQKVASALVAKVKGGTPLAQAAKAAGLEAATLTDVKQADYAAQSSPEIARAAFTAKLGDVVGPLRAPLGFVVLRVEQARVQPARTLAEATPEIRAKLAPAKTAQLLVAKRNAIDDALSGSPKFDAVVARQGLTVQRAPALLSSGIDPDNLAAKPDPALAPIVAAAFAANPADGAQTVPLDKAGSFAVVTVDKIVPPTVRPLAQVRDVAARDFQLDRAEHKAHAVAVQVIAAVNKGTPLPAALAATGLKLPPPQPVSGPRAQLLASQQEVPPPLQLLFAMPAKTARFTEAPNRGGYFIVSLDSIQRGDARGNLKVIEGTRGDLGRAIGREYGDQLAKAIQQAVGTTKNAKAIAGIKSELAGGAVATDQP